MSRTLHPRNQRFIPGRAVLAAALLLGAAPVAGAGDGKLKGEVSSGSGRALAGATVLVIELQKDTTTDADGSYTLSAPAGSYTVLATASGYELVEKSVTVSSGRTTTANFDLDLSVRFGDEIVVVGSRTARTALETPAPVDVLDVGELTDTGQTETSRMIQFVAPSFNFSTSTISDGTDIVRPSTLRGLQPDQTLVLVNGKRRHTSALVHVNTSIGRGTAGTDLNAIPASAIRQVEILRDGASAQYGSDAIAGVMNLGLKSSTGVTEINMTTGQHYEGDGEVFQASVNRGWRVTEDGGFVNATFEYRKRGWTNRAGRDPRRIFNFLEQERGEAPLSSGTEDPREATYDRLNHRYGDAESENTYFFFNSEVPMNASTRFYLFGGYADRNGESAGFNRLPSQSRTNTFLHPEGHLPLINTSVDDFSLSGGFRYNWSTWVADLGVTWGSNEFNFFISNSANTSMGQLSPTEADAGDLKFRQLTLNLDLVGSIDRANVAAGIEVRQDRYQIIAGEAASWVDAGVPDQFGGIAPAGIQVFPGFRPVNEVDESRENIGIYGEVDYDVTEELLVSAAARFEDYSDFGNSLSGKLSGRYEVNEALAVRGSVSSGFRAPSLHQSNFNNVSTQFVLVGGETVPLEVGTFRIGSDVANALGAQPLKEETSISGSLGFTLQPIDNLLLTLDFFRIDIDDRIVLSGLFRTENPQIAPLLEPLGVRGGQFFTNAIDTETWGADLVVSWRGTLGDGDTSLALTGAANWNETDVVGDVKTPDVLAGLGETLFDRRERAFVEHGQPRQLYNIGGTLKHGPVSTNLRFNYFGEVLTVEVASDPSIDQVFEGKWLTDLSCTYDFPNGLSVTVGGNNIFDVFPDENRDEISFNGIFVYPRRTAPFGFNGGYYYGRLGYRF